MQASSPESRADISLAVIAQVLYLVNLLLLPGLGFLILLLLYITKRQTTDDLSVFHMRQAISASLWAGILLVVCNGVILLAGGYDGPWTWVILITYFTIAHSTLILLGTIALIKAMAGQYWRYPLIGKLLG
jgi:uncharacterized Tic20 family protein